ncbi:hypothetical protein SCALM49S_04144 [Streptomyces californicus]
MKEPRWATEHLRATTQVTADCPDGLAGCPRPVTRFRVHASLSADGAEVAGAAEELSEVVAAAADHVRVRGGCGGRVVEPSDVRPPAPGPAVAPYEESEEVPPSCRWFRPGMLDGGDPDDGVTHDEVDACSVRVARVKPANRLDHFASVSSVSWRGRLLPEARTAYGAELAALSRPGAGGRREVVHAGRLGRVLVLGGPDAEPGGGGDGRAPPSPPTGPTGSSTRI